MKQSFSVRAVVSRALIAAQVLGLCAAPLEAAQSERARTVASAAAQPQPAAAPRPGPPDKKIVPNRTLPKVSAPSFAVQFGDTPSADEVMRARVLPEPLRPAERAPTTSENVAVARALEAFAANPNPAGTTALASFVSEHPDSPWRAAVLANVATLQWREGYYSRAAKSWETAWLLTKDGSDASSRAVADYAVSEWLTQAMNFGQVRALEARLEEIGTRAIGGSAGNKVNAAREGLFLLKNHHEMAVFSGPEALKALAGVMQPANAKARDAINAYRPSHEGTSLSALRDLARQVTLPLEMRFVSSIDDVPVPSIIHLKSQHYSTVIARTDTGLVVRDATLGGELVLTFAALRDELTGYVLVPAAKPDAVGRAVSAAEGDTIFGHCAPGLPYDDDDCGCGGGGGGNYGMPGYDLHPMTASVLVSDTPVFYAPPRGPAMNFTLRYNQRTSRLGQTPTFGNVGRRWSVDWLSFVQDNNTMAQAPYAWTSVVLRGEGQETYNSYSGYTHWKRRATLVEVSHDPVRWERRLPDGGVEVYATPDRAATLPNRKVFLTEVIDPQGQTLSFTYDASMRLVAVTDAMGQVSTFAYEDADPLHITKMTDPFGRSATLTYDAAGRLASITDVIGMTSTFMYDASDFMVAMTTPYGTTTFRSGDPSLGFRRIEATDPEGGTERIEYHQFNTASLPTTAPAGDVPAGFSDWNHDLHLYNSLYWTKQAMAEAPGDVSRAVITHWLIGTEMAYETHAGTWNIPHSIKRPLESRVWYRYPDQPPTSYATRGTGTSPTMVARVLDGGASQLTQATYNTLGMITSRTDPVGRRTTFSYAANGIDVLEVRQIKPGGSDLLGTYSNYDATHHPGTAVDAAGQTTTSTYDVEGRPLTVTNPKQETHTYAYDAVTGFLSSVTRAIEGARTTYTYDGYGRLRTITDADGSTLTMDYDALNRVTRRSYADGSFEQLTYERMDLVEERDRLGRLTRSYYDAVGRFVARREANGVIVRQEWSNDGTLAASVDGKGVRTTFQRDIQGRVIRRTRGDETVGTTFTYDASGRLKTVTDPKSQITTNTYAVDDAVTLTAYSNAAIPTPSITHSYDAVYPRVATMTDGVGTTAYSYQAPGQPGAGQVGSIDGPLPNDTVTYAYDELGRLTARAVNGAAITWAFDSLGRLVTEVNAVGAFTYEYDGVTPNLASITYPNGQTSAYEYLPASSDHRLASIHHKLPDGTTLSKFDYTYDVTGNITTWSQTFGAATPVLWAYGYDGANQLMTAIKEQTGASATVLSRYEYDYDRAGNRTVERVDDQVTTTSHDQRDRLIARAPGGSLSFAGTVSEAASVTIQGQAATVDAANHFRAAALLAGGGNVVSIAATDASGNQSTRTFSVGVTGSAAGFDLDPDGNLTADGTRSFEWDARNQLTAVTVGAHRTEFTYDGLRRRVRVVEKENSITQSDHRFVWCETTLCEERDADGTTVLRRPFAQSEQVNGVARYLVRDHLGSVTEVTDSSATLLARYAFDPWGRRMLQTGSDVTSIGFTGHEVHQPSGLYLSLYRAYDASLGRWLSEDPAGPVDGPNLFRYVRNQPTQAIDPLGLQLYQPGPPPSSRAPLGCTGGPWRFVGHGLESRDWQRKWEHVRDIMLELPGFTKTPKDDDMLPVGLCYAIYRQVGIVEVTKTYELWDREVSCLCGKTYTEHGRTDRRTEHDALYITTNPAREIRLSGFVSNGECVTSQPPLH